MAASVQTSPIEYPVCVCTAVKSQYIDTHTHYMLNTNPLHLPECSVLLPPVGMFH